MRLPDGYEKKLYGRGHHSQTQEQLLHTQKPPSRFKFPSQANFLVSASDTAGEGAADAAQAHADADADASVMRAEDHADASKGTHTHAMETPCAWVNP